MKKKLHATLIITMICFCTNVSAQTNKPVISAGGTNRKTAETYLDPVLNLVGTNFNYGSSNAALKDYKKSILGAQVGLSFQAGVTKNFSLVPEFYFMMKGGKLKASNPLTTTETILRLYTVELPVLARVHVGKFYVNAGPSIAYNIGGTSKIESASKSVSFGNSIDGYKRFDAGIQMGGGFMFPLKQKRVAIDLRYNYGLTNISNGREMYNRSFIISVHFSRAWKTNPLAKHSNR